MNNDNLFIGASTDPEIIEASENGGLVTSVLRFVLREGLVDGVVAIRKGRNRYEGVLVYVENPEEVANCAGTLHFATPSIAKFIKKYVDTFRHRVAVVCKSCDARAIVELAKINQITIENVLMIGINCSGTLAPVRHMTMLRDQGIDPYRLEWENIDGSTLAVRLEDGTAASFDLEELEEKNLGRRSNCRRCDHPIPRMADLACGKWGLGKDAQSNTFVEVCSEKGRELLERAADAGAIALSAATDDQIARRAREEERKICSARTAQREDFAENPDTNFWADHFENCIKCYSCRDVCPICHCKRCVLERDNPETVTKGVIPPPLLFGMLRILHVTCQCINCGQCEDVCQSDIPLSRLTHKLNSESARLFGYEAGIDRAAFLPLCVIPEEEKIMEAPDLAGQQVMEATTYAADPEGRVTLPRRQ